MSTESAYAYTKTQWQNGVTPINEGNLNKIEDGIATALSSFGYIDMYFYNNDYNYSHLEETLLFITKENLMQVKYILL